ARALAPPRGADPAEGPLALAVGRRAAGTERARGRGPARHHAGRVVPAHGPDGHHAAAALGPAGHRDPERDARARGGRALPRGLPRGLPAPPRRRPPGLPPRRIRPAARAPGRVLPRTRRARPPPRA